MGELFGVPVEKDYLLVWLRLARDRFTRSLVLAEGLKVDRVENQRGLVDMEIWELNDSRFLF